jgi:hypothetical protein
MLVAALMALSLSVQQTSGSANAPPVDSPPLVRFVEIAFPSQGNASLVDAQTYLYYIHTRPRSSTTQDRR